MGSLMAGWDSPTLDPNTVRLERNRSLTKEDIEAFWKIHGDSQEDRQQQFQAVKPQEGKSRKPRSQSSPNSPRFTLHGTEYLVDVDKACKTDDWWTRSSWAFLNEPPVEETQESSYNYTPQFHVAQLAAKRSMDAN